MEVITHSKHAVNVGQAERIASIIAGSALAVLGLKRRSPAGIALAVVGGGLLRRGATGHCSLYQAMGVRTAPKGQGAETTSVPYELGVRVDKSITVGRPVEEVYHFWRDFENLARFLQHVESIRTTDGRHSRWVVRAPAGRTVEWDAEINNEVENELIGWRSLPGADVDNAGSVHFRPAPDGRGTEVRVELQYNPPGGTVGALIARMLGQEPGVQIQEDLRRFKQIMETGEIPTTHGQTSGRREEPHRPRGGDTVEHASEQSFPASDAPAWR